VNDSPEYLIWSHECAAWLRRDGLGPTRRLSQAGRYSRTDALTICTQSIPGPSRRRVALPELPVRLIDVETMMAVWHQVYPDSGAAWE
jgi:hypothetical protein